MRVIAVLVAAWAGWAGGVPAQDEPPSKSELKKLVEECFEIPPEERGPLLERIALTPPLSERERETWQEKTLPKLAEKAGPKLEKGGDNWFWEKEKKGRYIVRGKPRNGLMIGLHGGGLGSGDAGSSASAFGSAAGDMGWVSIYPEVLEKTEHGWTDSGTEEFVIGLIEAALRTWKLDPDQVYLAGHSMGGYGTWTLGAHHADRFAGLAAYAGAPTPYWNQQQEVIGIVEGVLPNLRNVPFHIYQSLDDPQVPAAVNIFANKALAAEKEKYGGFNYVYEEVDGRGHGFPEGGPGPALEWIGQYTRDVCPKKVVWEPVLTWKKQFYWLRWENPHQGPLIQAEVVGDNQITITTSEKVKGLTVLLDERLVDFSKKVSVRLNGSEIFLGMVEPRLEVLVRCAAETMDTGRWFVAEVGLIP